MLIFMRLMSDQCRRLVFYCSWVGSIEQSHRGAGLGYGWMLVIQGTKNQLRTWDFFSRWITQAFLYRITQARGSATQCFAAFTRRKSVRSRQKRSLWVWVPDVATAYIASKNSTLNYSKSCFVVHLSSQWSRAAFSCDLFPRCSVN